MVKKKKNFETNKTKRLKNDNMGMNQLQRSVIVLELLHHPTTVLIHRPCGCKNSPVPINMYVTFQMGTLYPHEK